MFAVLSSSAPVAPSGTVDVSSRSPGAWRYLALALLFFFGPASSTTAAALPLGAAAAAAAAAVVLAVLALLRPT